MANVVMVGIGLNREGAGANGWAIGPGQQAGAVEQHSLAGHGWGCCSWIARRLVKRRGQGWLRDTAAMIPVVNGGGWWEYHRKPRTGNRSDAKYGHFPIILTLLCPAVVLIG